MKFEVELDDKGEFVGTLAPELSSVIERIKGASHGEGFGKGASKAAEEAKAQIASTVAAEKIKLESAFATDRLKWGEIEELNKHLKTQLDANANEHRKTLTAREEAHAEEITRRSKAAQVRDDQIRGLVNASLRSLAAQYGAREESLPELEVILQHRIGYDDNMVPFVKAEDGSGPAKTTAGNPLGIDVFVKSYLDNHPHHRKPAAGQGGNARGGASLRHAGGGTDFEQAKARLESGDRSMDAINDAFSARLNKRKSA